MRNHDPIYWLVVLIVLLIFVAVAFAVIDRI